MLAALALMLVALADCHGLLGIDVDALSLGDADADGPQLASCDWSSGFETPEPVTSLNTIEWEWEARLSPDELTAYISRAAEQKSFGTSDQARASRGSVDFDDAVSRWTDLHRKKRIEVTALERHHGCESALERRAREYPQRLLLLVETVDRAAIRSDDAHVEHDGHLYERVRNDGGPDAALALDSFRSEQSHVSIIADLGSNVPRQDCPNNCPGCCDGGARAVAGIASRIRRAMSWSVTTAGDLEPGAAAGAGLDVHVEGSGEPLSSPPSSPEAPRDSVGHRELRSLGVG